MARINTIFPDDMVHVLDNIAQTENTTRSRLLREAIINFIDAYHGKIEEKKRQDRIQKAMAIQDTLRSKSGDWDGVMEIRKWRNKI